MKFFRKYIFPALFGLAVYFTIRLLHDVDIGAHFWRREWSVNAIEMTASILTGYVAVYMFERLFRYFDEHRPAQFRYENLMRELLITVGANLALVTVAFIPVAAFTGDGLDWADLVDIWAIPSLWAVIYYGVGRSRTFMKAYIDNRVLLEKVTNDHLTTELKFLKSQYHPHFLFNALNTIYFQMDEDVNEAKKSIEKFSELLRYQLYDQQQQVPVMNEMEYLKSFIDLQKVRSSDKLKLQVNIGKELNGQLVYPLLFLPLVENAFKFIGGDYQLNIEAAASDTAITFSVQNSVPEFDTLATQKGGIGLENLKRRLDLLYPGKHSFYAEKQGGTYKAELRLEYA